MAVESAGVPQPEQNPLPSGRGFPQAAQESTPAPQCEQKRFPGPRSLPQPRQVRVVAIVPLLLDGSVVLLNIEDRRTGAQCRRYELLPRLCCGTPSEPFT